MTSFLSRVHVWLRRVVPDLFLAAVVALLVTVAANHLESNETRRIGSNLQAAAENGLTLDEHVDVLSESVRRSAFLHLPVLAGIAGALVGLGCRNRRWAWLTAVLAVVPTLLWGGALFIDRPATAGGLAAAYAAIAVVPATATAAARNHLWPRRPAPPSPNTPEE
jgi:hypothetical protein